MLHRFLYNMHTYLWRWCCNDPFFCVCVHMTEQQHFLTFFFLTSLIFKVFVLRKKVTHRIPRPGARFYICSLSPDVIVYKGQLTSNQVWTYFADLDVSFELTFGHFHLIEFLNSMSTETRIWNLSGPGAHSIFDQYVPQLGTSPSVADVGS